MFKSGIFFSDFWYTKQGCQMVCFQTKNPNLGKFWRVLQWKIFVYFMTIWSILRPLKVFYGHLVYFVVIWYISPRFWYIVPRKIFQPLHEGDKFSPVLHTTGNGYLVGVVRMYGSLA
jgi:hypothetical protein